MQISNLLYSEEQCCFHIAPVTDPEGQESNGYKLLVEFKDDRELTLLTRFIRLEYPSINVDREDVPSFKDVLDCTNYILDNLNTQKIKVYYQIQFNEEGEACLDWFLPKSEKTLLEKQTEKSDVAAGSVETFIGSDIYLEALTKN